MTAYGEHRANAYGRGINPHPCGECSITLTKIRSIRPNNTSAAAASEVEMETVNRASGLRGLIDPDVTSGDYVLQGYLERQMAGRNVVDPRALIELKEDYTPKFFDWAIEQYRRSCETLGKDVDKTIIEEARGLKREAA